MFNYNNQNEKAKSLNTYQNENFDLLQKARLDLIGEIQAVIEYDNHINSTNHTPAKETWENIRDEELVHIGELLGLLNHLAPYQAKLVQKGVEEFLEREK